MDYSFAYLVGIAFWFYLFTVGSGILADRKQRGVWAWALLGFIFGPFAFATILLLGPATEPRDPLIRSEPYVPMDNCPHCLSSIPARALVCRYCTRDVAALTPPTPNGNTSSTPQRAAPKRPLTVAEWDALERSEGHPTACVCPQCLARKERATLAVQPSNLAGESQR